MDKIYHNGVEMLSAVDDSSSVMTFTHMYRTNYEGTIRQHKCIEFNYWCWKQVRENPLNALAHIKVLFRSWQKK